MNRERTLDEVRADIDSIDDTIQDLLIRRTELVEEVRSIKRDWRVKIQPSREAKIIYRLIERHRGPFPKRDLVAMWRILICATLSFEGPFSVAVHVPAGGDGGYWDLARDHFGPCTPFSRHGSVHSVIETVRRQEAIVGVLPLPHHDDTDPWWRHIATSHPEAPKIIARLPFAGFAGGGAVAVEALVICPVTVVPTGRDRSFLAAESESRIGLEQFGKRLREAGFDSAFATLWREREPPQGWLYLAEVEGWLAADDPRLQRLQRMLGRTSSRPLVLGGYTVPLSPESLGPPPTAAHAIAPIRQTKAEDTPAL
jgi:chorismate mutase / prephenate dehydratase